MSPLLPLALVILLAPFAAFLINAFLARRAWALAGASTILGVGIACVASLLVLHGLHPEDLRSRVQKALVQVRPYLGSHGGDVEIVDADTHGGVVRLRMKGSCDGCPSSALTVKLAVEGAIRELGMLVVGGKDKDAAGILQPVGQTTTRMLQRKGSDGR